MANMLFANNCNTTLNGGITAVATSMVVTSATGFPVPTGSQYFYCTLADAATQTTIEIVKVTAVSGTTFTIVRGQDGTTGTIFASGAVVSLRLVRANLNDFPKLDETNTFTADQAITGQLTTSAGLATTNTFTATAPADGLVMDYATGFGRFSAFAGDGFQWYNAGVANTKLMQLSSTGVITTATWNGATVGVAYGGTGLTTLTAGYIPYGNGTGAFSSSSVFNYSAGTLSTPSLTTTGTTELAISGGVVTIGTTNTSFGGLLMIRNDAGICASFNSLYTNGAAINLSNIGVDSFGIGMPTSTGDLAFYSSGYVAGTRRVTFFGTGGVSIGNTTDPGAGNLRLATTGTNGIYFGASSKLADYEEGTWTPTLSFGGGSVTYTTQSGQYTKIGRQVTLQAKIVINVASSPSSFTLIQGIPYLPAYDVGSISIYANGMTATATTTWMGIPRTNNDLRIYVYTAGSLVNPGAYFQNGSEIDITVTYFV